MWTNKLALVTYTITQADTRHHTENTQLVCYLT